MDYVIAQRHKYEGHDYWNWSAWIEPPEGLREIERVIWILHPTFSPSRVETTAVETAFRLDTSGWGAFLLRAELHFHDGNTRRISRMLKLTYPDAEQGSVPSMKKPSGESAGYLSSTPYVFISYASEDTGHAATARNVLKELGVQVRDAAEIEPGVPFDAAVRKIIRESAGVLSVVGSNYASPFVINEMKLAAQEEKPVATVLPDDVERPAGFTTDLRELRFGKSSGSLEKQVSSFVGELRSRGIV